ncbi:MAG: replication initiator protein A [bacterium]
MGKSENQEKLWGLEAEPEPASGAGQPDSAEPDSNPAGEFKDEMNLAEFPIAALTDRVPDGTTTLVFEDQIEHEGDSILRRLSISGHGKLGLPAALDDQVIVGLIQLTKRQNNFTNSRVHFSRYELIDLLGWQQDGHSYRRIEDALNRWVGVVLSYENAWWDNTEKSWVDETFHIIDNVTLYDREKAMSKAKAGRSKPPKPLSSFKWNDVMFRSFQSGNLKQLDLEYYLSLRLPTSKRLYRFLDKRFYHCERVDFDLRTLACEHVGMSREYAPTELKRKLRTAFDELEKSGFLEPLNDNERYISQEKGRWRVLFVRGSKRRAEEEEARELNTAEALYEELLKRGVHHQVARDIVERHATNRIRAKIEVFDWLITNEQEMVLHNPAGYLVASIRDDYMQPDEYVPKMKKAGKKKAKTDQDDDETGPVEIQPEQDKPAANAKNTETSKSVKTEADEAMLQEQWNALPDDVRDDITAHVNKQHKGLLQWAAMRMPMYLDEMTRRYGSNPPVAPLPSGISITEKLIREEESRNSQAGSEDKKSQ